MKNHWKLMLCLLLVGVVLSGCSGQPTTPQIYPEMTQNLGPGATDAPTAPPQENQPATDGDPSIFSANPYDVPNPDEGYSPDDAIGEENFNGPDTLDNSGIGGLSAMAEGTYYPYAGSTPIPLDPVDAPTPTPRPELKYTYASYSAAIGLSFEAPVGWVVDETQSDLFIISEPMDQVKEGQQCILTISAVPVNSNYSESNLKAEVTNRLDVLGATNFLDWKPSLTATRHLMGSKGVYANYTGKLVNGIEVGGRIHYASIDNVLYGLEIVYPLGYKDDYLNVFSKIRETMKRN